MRLLGRYILDADTYPVPEPDLLTWARWLERSENRITARTEIARDVVVSTVFLGLASNDEGEPLLWETMIIGGPHAGRQRRDASKADALIAHELAVLIAKGKTTPEAISEMERDA